MRYRHVLGEGIIGEREVAWAEWPVVFEVRDAYCLYYYRWDDECSWMDVMDGAGEDFFNIEEKRA